MKKKLSALPTEYFLAGSALLALIALVWLIWSLFSDPTKPKNNTSNLSIEKTEPPQVLLHPSEQMKQTTVTRLDNASVESELDKQLPDIMARQTQTLIEQLDAATAKGEADDPSVVPYERIMKMQEEGRVIQ